MGATRVLIVANPAAGSVTPTLVWEIVRVCRRQVDRVSVRWTTGPGDAFRIAESSVDDVVVAVGGDGTARDVAAGLAAGWSRSAMLIVPAGTANSCYHTLFGTEPWQTTVADALRTPSSRRLDLARLGDRMVFAGASAGFSARAIHEARALASHAGPARYHAALVGLIPRYRPYPGRVTVDGRVVHSGPTLLANVGGSRFRGGYFELLPRSVQDDGLLDVCVIDGAHSPAYMMELTRTGAHLGLTGVRYERGRSVRIERTDGRPLWFEHDGEVLPLDRTEYTVDVVPAAVRVLSARAPALTV
jgi:diacylglycerol kinase (ATP)